MNIFDNEGRLAMALGKVRLQTRHLLIRQAI